MIGAIKIHTEQLREAAKGLRAGERVLLSGAVYTARDAAHRRLFEMMSSGESLPLDIDGAVIYYAGPTPARAGMAVGSCGPTTSGRMDIYTPKLLSLGLCGMIGKGERSAEVEAAIRATGSIYLCAVGGAGALMACCIKSVKEVAFTELGCESIKLMQVEDMPLIVGIDPHGGNVFRAVRAAMLQHNTLRE